LDVLSHQNGSDARDLAGITHALVGLHTEYYGQGPTKARSYMIGYAVVSILEGGFMTVEKTLMAEGRAIAVHHVRRSFQSAMEGRFRSVVEDGTGRKVVAYISQIHTDPDLAVELFVLDGTTEAAAEAGAADGHPDPGSRPSN
jgi:uncharacterized protein YbcI